MNTLRNLWRYAMVVSRSHGKSIPRQAAEIVRLGLGPRRISPIEYYELELFDDSLIHWNVTGHFAGHRSGTYLDRLLSREAWATIACDKVVHYQILSSLGLPIPHSIASYNRHGRRIGFEPVFGDVDSLLHFIGRTKPYPFFIKPVRGDSGVASFGIRSIDWSTETVVLIDGRSIRLDTLVREISQDANGGMLLQSLLTPHHEIVEVFGERLGALQIVTLLTDSGPRIHRVIWKLAGSRTDQTHHGKSSKMQGWIDRDTGTLDRVIFGSWPDGQQILEHPDTGSLMRGFRIPHWDNVREIILAAAVHFPGLRIQSWEVALCEDGPVLLELSKGSRIDPQLVDRGRGSDRPTQSFLGTPESELPEERDEVDVLDDLRVDSRETRARTRW